MGAGPENKAVVTKSYTPKISKISRVSVSIPSPQIGVFFDGTGNNLFNDIQYLSDDKEPTNISKLFTLYPLDVEYIRRVYIEGIGTKAGEPDQDWDQAVAQSFGDRLQQAIKGLRAFCLEYSKFKHAKLDVFGFSRGAASARAFVNEVHRLATEDPGNFSGVAIEFRFVGIFDTVGSIGLAGDNSQRDFRGREFTLDLHPDAARYVYHLTAGHEQREYFPLSSILTGPGQSPASHFVEKELLGAHADVGGGYGPVPDVVYYPMKSVGWSNRAMREQKLRELKQAYEREYYAPGIDIDLNVMRDVQAGAGMYAQTAPLWKRNVKFHLSHVALHEMHTKACECGVPLEPLDKLVGKGEFVGRSALELYEVPADLQSHLQTGARGEEYIYRHYIHHSHQYRAKPDPGNWSGLNSNKPESHPDRRAANGKREIFYNDINNGNSKDVERQRFQVPTDNGLEDFEGVYP